MCCCIKDLASPWLYFGADEGGGHRLPINTEYNVAKIFMEWVVRVAYFTDVMIMFFIYFIYH